MAINYLHKSISSLNTALILLGFVSIVGIFFTLLFIYSRSGNIRSVLLENSFIGQNKVGCTILHGRWVQLNGIPEAPSHYGCYFSP